MSKSTLPSCSLVYLGDTLQTGCEWGESNSVRTTPLLLVGEGRGQEEVLSALIGRQWWEEIQGGMVEIHMLRDVENYSIVTCVSNRWQVKIWFEGTIIILMCISGFKGVPIDNRTLISSNTMLHVYFMRLKSSIDQHSNYIYMKNEYPN